MHISVICDLDACIYDAGFFRYQPTNERTNGQGDSRSRIMGGIVVAKDKPECVQQCTLRGFTVASDWASF